MLDIACGAADAARRQATRWETPTALALTPSSADAPRPRFSAAERAVDPLLAEEDTSAAFALMARDLSWPVRTFMRVILVDPRTYLVAAFVVLIWEATGLFATAGLLPVALVAGSGLLAVTSRLAEHGGLPARLRPLGRMIAVDGGSWRRRGTRAAWEAGVRPREIAVAEYLMMRAGPGLPRVATHSAQAGAFCVAVAVSSELGAEGWLAVIIAWLAFSVATLPVARTWALIGFLNSTYTREMRRRAASLRHSALTRRLLRSRARQWELSKPPLLVGALVIPAVCCGGVALSECAGLILDVATGGVVRLPPDVCAVAVAGVCLFARARQLRDQLERLGSALLGYQNDLLSDAELLVIAEQTEADANDPDSIRWLEWQFDFLRTPGAPCPELDARWLAAHGTD